MIALKNILVATDLSKCSVAPSKRDPHSPRHSMPRCTCCTSPPRRFTSRAGYTPGAEFVRFVRRLDAEGREQLETAARSTGLRAEQLVLATAWAIPPTRYSNTPRSMPWIWSCAARTDGEASTT